MERGLGEEGSNDLLSTHVVLPKPTWKGDEGKSVASIKINVVMSCSILMLIL